RATRWRTRWLPMKPRAPVTPTAAGATVVPAARASVPIAPPRQAFGHYVRPCHEREGEAVAGQVAERRAVRHEHAARAGQPPVGRQGVAPFPVPERQRAGVVDRRAGRHLLALERVAAELGERREDAALACFVLACLVR